MEMNGRIRCLRFGVDYDYVILDVYFSFPTHYSLLYVLRHSIFLALGSQSKGNFSSPDPSCHESARDTSM